MGIVRLILAIMGILLIAPLAFSQTTGVVLPERLLPRIDAVHPAWQQFEPRFQSTVCPFTGTRAYDAERFRCGYVLVPEDRSLRTSRLIRLSVLQVKSSAQSPGQTAMVYLTGGPGGPSLGLHRLSRFQTGHNASLLAHMDMVWFDQRGVGYSGGDFCRAVPMPYAHGGITTDARTAYLAEVERCVSEARARGMAVEGYTNWQNALDVRDIRRALGYEVWNLFGISYGTELAQGVMQVDPEGTRAVVLDSVVPAGYTVTNLDGMYAAGFRSALTAVETMCANDPVCAARYPGTALSERFIAAFDAYQADPLPLSGLAPHLAVTGEIMVDGTVAAGAVFQALYNKSVYGDLPALLRVLESRNAEALRTYVEVLSYPIDHRYGMGMALAINCRAGFREDAAGASPPGGSEPDLSRYMGTLNYYDGCETILPAASDPTVTPASSDIPTLVAMGEVDPITPPYYADMVMPRLGEAQRIDVPNTGHGALLSHWSGCGQRVVLDFFLAPAERVDAGCLKATPAPEFLVDIRETSGPYKFGRALQAGTYPYLPAAAAAFLALLGLAFPLGALARRIDGTQSGDYGRARVLVWLGGLASIAGATFCIRAIIQTATQHSATLPIGVPTAIATGGWLALAGAALGALALIALVRSAGSRHRTVGTQIAIVLGALATFTILWFLFSIDAGPVMT